MAENFIDVFDDNKQSSNFVDVFDKQKPFVDVFETKPLPGKGLLDSMVNLYQQAEEGKIQKQIIPEGTKPEIDVTVNPYKDYDKKLIKELKNITVGAVRDTAQSSVDFLSFLLPGDPLRDVKFPQVEEPSNVVSSIVRDLIGFAIPYAGVSKLQALAQIPQATTKIGAFGQAVIKGGLAEQMAFSPYEQRLSNLVQEYPSLQNSVTEYLKADSADDETTARKKMFIEGSLLGIPIELISLTLGRGKANKFVKPSKDADPITKNIDTIDAENVNPATIHAQKEQIEGIEKINLPPKSKEELLNIKTTKVLDEQKELYVYYANKDAGQKIGNKEIIVKLDNEYYDKYIKNLSDEIFQIEKNNNFYTYSGKNLIKINKDFNNISKIPFEELKNKEIYLKLSSVDNKPFSIKEIDTLQNIRPKNEYALKVDSFENKVAIERRNKSDSLRTANEILLDKNNLELRLRGIESNTIASQNIQQQKKIEELLGTKPRTLEGTKLPEEITRPAIKEKFNQKILNAAEELLTTGKVRRNPNLTLTEQVSDLIITGRIEDKTFNDILKKNKIKLDEFAVSFAADKADAGRTLQRLSVIEAKINKLKGVPNADRAYNAALSASGADEFVLSAGQWSRLDNIRKASLTGQVATAIRNFETAAGTAGTDVMSKGMDVALRSAYRKVFKNLPEKSLANPITAFEGFTGIFRQIDRKNYKLVKEQTDMILSSFPKEQDKLFLRYSSDIVTKSDGKDLLGKGEKAVHLINFFNRLQEFIVRRSVFQSSLDELIRNNPKHYSNRKLSQIIADNDYNIFRKQDIADAVEKALEVTFAKNFNQGKGTYESVANLFIRLVNKIPFTASLAIPFPRFIFNSLKFHAEYSPTGFFRYFSASEREAFAKGNTIGLSKAIVGSSILGAAYMLRQQPYAGEKWYEFKIGNRTIDFRAFNPFAAYLFVADGIKRIQEGTLSGWDLKGFVNVFTGIRGGTGLYLIDRFIDGVTGVNPNIDFKKEVNKIAGDTIGGFFVPLQTLQDTIGQFYPEMQIVKDASGNPIKDNILKRLPLKNNLPPIVSATDVIFDEYGVPRAAPIKREDPLLRQLPPSLSFISPKNYAEKEIDRLGIPPRTVFTSTGIPELDVAYKNALAPQIAINLSKIVQDPNYQQLTNATKLFVVESFLTDAKRKSTTAIQNNESLTPFLLKYQIENIPLLKRRVIDEAIANAAEGALGKDFLKELVNTYIKKK